MPDRQVAAGATTTRGHQPDPLVLTRGDRTADDACRGRTVIAGAREKLCILPVDSGAAFRKSPEQPARRGTQDRQRADSSCSKPEERIGFGRCDAPHAASDKQAPRHRALAQPAKPASWSEFKYATSETFRPMSCVQIAQRAASPLAPTARRNCGIQASMKLFREPGPQPEDDLARIDQALRLGDDGMARPVLVRFCRCFGARRPPRTRPPKRKPASSPALEVAKVAERTRRQVISKRDHAFRWDRQPLVRPPASPQITCIARDTALP